MKTVLLIEDNKDIRENTYEILTLEGYDVIASANGINGLALAKENLPDIILCDIWMPGLNGYEVFENLKKDTNTLNIPFIFLTASADKNEVETGLGMGANGYIRKPIEHDTLINEIELCLNALI